MDGQTNRQFLNKYIYGYLNTGCWQEAANEAPGTVLDAPLSMCQWFGWYSSLTYYHNLNEKAGLPWSMSNADQCRSKSWHWSKIILNWEELIGNDRYWSPLGSMPGFLSASGLCIDRGSPEKDATTTIIIDYLNKHVTRLAGIMALWAFPVKWTGRVINLTFSTWHHLSCLSATL